MQEILLPWFDIQLQLGTEILVTPQIKMKQSSANCQL